MLLIFLLVFLSCEFSVALKADIMQHKGFLGRVGYKAFLVERNIGDWKQGKSFCESLGMRMATIETLDELNFLNTKYQQRVFAGWHWTAARDSHQPQQFVWDDNNSSAKVALAWVPNERLETTYLSCAAFCITEPKQSMMFIVECENTDGHVLCEIKGSEAKQSTK